VLVKPNPNSKTIKTAKLTFFFIALLLLLLEDALKTPCIILNDLDSRVFM
jgi:hypothetical protein